MTLTLVQATLGTVSVKLFNIFRKLVSQHKNNANFVVDGDFDHIFVC